MASDLAPVERRLRAILQPYRGRFAVVGDVPRESVYAFPELGQDMSPELRRRMQGKSCFNFTFVDQALMAELDALTAQGLDRYQAAAVTGEGPFAAERFRPARQVPSLR
jgi:hypothetical protein